MYREIFYMKIGKRGRHYARLYGKSGLAMSVDKFFLLLKFSVLNFRNLQFIAKFAAIIILYLLQFPTNCSTIVKTPPVCWKILAIIHNFGLYFAIDMLPLM